MTMLYLSSGDAATAMQKAKVEEVEGELQPLKAAVHTAAIALSGLLKQERGEICSFIEEPVVPEEVQAELAAASQGLKEAKAQVALLRRYDAIVGDKVVSVHDVTLPALM